MNISRGLLVWGVFALCGVLVLGAMGWLTRDVLASERERSVAEARADLEERTRLALWRMDAAGAAIVAGETRHSPADYNVGCTAFNGVSDSLVKLHFQVRESDGLSSPEAERPQVLQRLLELRALLGKHPVPSAEWTVMKCAADEGEKAWQAIPKDAPLQVFENGQIRNMKSQQPRQQVEYQSNANAVEQTKRAKSVDETVANSYQQQILPAQMDQGPPGGLQGNGNVSELGPMRALWLGGELFLVRQLSGVTGNGPEKLLQGVWLDSSVLKQRLLAEIADLLPAANLTESASAEDTMALVSFPYQLARHEIPSAAKIGPNMALIVGWSAVVVALVTGSLLVLGVMRLSERRASFVSAVTHELRTPLTTFRLYSDMLAGGAVKEEKRAGYLNVLSREADRLSHLVENVLSFSRIERGSARATPRETTLINLLEPMRERFAARLATADLQLDMDLTSPVAQQRIKVDAAAVEHILFNLIDNAAKYATGSVPPLVHVGVEIGQGLARVVVSDHGGGIPVSERKRIFQAFHKSAREAAETRPGVGLGLALSRRLAKEQGGDLTCVDAPQGARFVLELPMI